MYNLHHMWENTIVHFLGENKANLKCMDAGILRGRVEACIGYLGGTNIT